ncbi:hypothetical protein VTP01DRAFT_7766 [Rhizomucor pusillus]|uniref:uncharacterized protein n=1 Tax=Rhizomucor pusillus TaxID=4840 RepID=UPI003742CD97
MSTTTESSNFSVGGVLLALVCVYLLGGRILRLYMYEQTGRSVMRPRPVVQVVVLGDIGRSPRMRCHAVSCADAGLTVDLVGYVDTAPGSRITTNRHIRIRRVRSAWSVPEGFPRLLYVAWAPFKAIFVASQLVWIMGCITAYPDYILIQNPPAIPTLAIARCIAFLRGAKLIIDWHNFGYSILGMKLGPNNKVVKAAKAYEKYFGSRAYAHLTVTERMHRELEDWRVSGQIVTFKDRPSYHFKRLDVQKIHQALQEFRLEELVRRDTVNANEFLGGMDSTTTTLLTRRLDGKSVVWREDRVRLIVSSTSWTDDEDFSMLLDAVQEYERRSDASYPKLLFVITGKGPLRQMYEEKISAMQLDRTRIVTAWLAAKDYPLLLGSADLGISLHTSSSGMDLPMKVVDMFGCGLPVCAVGFECLDELVVHGRNGLVFHDSKELAEAWMDLFVQNPTRLDTLRSNVLQEFKEQTWERQWRDRVKPLLLSS